MLITNGPYILLKFIVNMILDIFKQNLNNDKSTIKDFINEKIKESHTTTIDNIIKNRKENITDIIYQFYLIFYCLRIHNIKHCLFYIGENIENEYENHLSKYMPLKKYNNKLDLENEQKRFHNDFIINNKIKEKIKELFDIKNNFKEVLENFRLAVYKDICKNENKKDNENKIAFFFNKISLDKDLIFLLIFIDKEHSEDGQKFLQPLIETKKFNIKVEYYENKFDSEQMENLKTKQYDIVIIVTPNSLDSCSLNLKLFNKNIKFFCVLFLYCDLFEQLKGVFRFHFVDNKLLKKKYYNIKPEIPKNVNIKSEILNFENLSNKISEELKVKIEKEKIDTLLSLPIDEKEKENFINKILKNFEEVNKVIKKDIEEKEIEELKKINEEKFKTVNENLKASILYDFIYYSLLPKKKYKLAKKEYHEYLYK